MSKLRSMLKRLTGRELDYRETPEYIAINLSYRYYVDAGQINDYILFESPEDFRKWLDENVAKVDQAGWVLFAPVEVL